MGRGPRVERAAPERVDALERKHRLRDVGLGNQDGTGCAQGGDELMIINLRRKKTKTGGREARTGASCSAGLLAHCVNPIVLSKPFTLTWERVRVSTSARTSHETRAEERTHVLDAHRHTVQRSLELSRPGELDIELARFLSGFLEEY